MTNLNAPTAAKSSGAVDPQKVIAWVDEDRLLVFDRTRHGLHRRVIARKDGCPNADVWLEAIHIHDKVDRNQLTHWFVQQDDFVFLWIIWKDKT